MTWGPSTGKNTGVQERGKERQETKAGRVLETGRTPKVQRGPNTSGHPVALPRTSYSTNLFRVRIPDVCHLLNTHNPPNPLYAQIRHASEHFFSGPKLRTESGNDRPPVPPQRSRLDTALGPSVGSTPSARRTVGSSVSCTEGW